MQIGYTVKVLLFIPLYCVWVMGTLAASLSIFTTPSGDTSPFGILLYIVLLFPPIWVFMKVLNAKPRWTAKVLADGKQANATILSVTDTGTRINNAAIISLKLRVNPTDDAPFEVSQSKEVSVLSGFGGYSDGSTVQVKYDPVHKHHLILLDGSTRRPDYNKPPKQNYDNKPPKHKNHDPQPSHLSHDEAAMSSADFAQELSNRSHQQHLHQQQQQHQSSVSGVVLADELARLADLHKSGDLSDSEYAAAKEKLLE